MLSPEQLEKIEKIAAEATGREGCIVYDIEMVGSAGGRILRIYIDKPGTQVSIDDCANVSRGINLLLDDEDIIPGRYHLEVSSPGVERPLKKLEHFRSAEGKMVKLTTQSTLGELGVSNEKFSRAKQVTGILVSCDKSDAVKIRVNEEDFELPIDSISKAQTIFEFDKDQQNNKKKR